MTTDSGTLMVGDLRVSVVRKAIRNLHLGVYPPDGRVRVAVPLAVSDAAIRVAVVSKLTWIRRQQAAFEAQVRESAREMVSGESHYYQGRRYRLTVIEAPGLARVALRRGRRLELCVPPEWDAGQRERLLQRWYRERLREMVPPLIKSWESRLGVEVREWGIRRMKTRWGSCNARASRIWLNLELVKKPPECLEYLVVHELVHLIVRNHDDRFTELMDRHYPKWRFVRKALNSSPLAHASWEY